LDHSKASNTIVTDHEDQATLRTLASDYLPDGHCATEGLEHADFSAFQVDANSELMFGFHDVSTSEDGGFNLHQLRDHGWHATYDNDVGPGQMRSGRLISKYDASVHDHRTCVKDIIQQNYEAMPNLQCGYDRSSMFGSLQGEPQEGCNSQSLGAQHIFQQDFDDPLVALSVRDIIQQDYGALFDIQEDTAMRTFVDQVDPTFWSM
jgi:hypothetical protein